MVHSKGVGMKKIAVISGVLVILISAGIVLAGLGRRYLIDQRSMDKIEILGEVSSIVLRDGSNGNSVIIDNEEEVKYIISQINEFQLKRGKEFESHTGWSFAVDIYVSGEDKPLSLVFRSNGFEYDGYFYGASAKVEELLGVLAQKFEYD